MNISTKENRMIKWISPKIPLIIVMFILSQPIIDVITSFSTRYLPYSITFGIVVRSLFMLLMVLYVFFVSSHKQIIKFRIYFFILSMYILAYGLNSLMTKGSSLFFTDVTGIVKTFYLPYVIVGLYTITEDLKIKWTASRFFQVVATYALIIFIALITGTSYTSYTWGGGYKGWFFAANEIGAIIACLAPIGFFYFVQNLNKIHSWIALGLVLFAGTFMGTKVPFFGIVGYVVCILLWSTACFLFVRDKNSKRIFLGTMAAAVLLASLFYVSPLKNNLFYRVGEVLDEVESQLDKTPGEINPDERPVVIDGEGPGTVQTMPNEEQPDAPGEIVETETGEVQSSEKPQAVHSAKASIWNKLLSNRLTFVEKIHSTFREASLSSKILGIGYNNRLNDGSINKKMIEMDFLDIAYSHGYLGTVLYFLPIGLFMLMALHWILKHPKTFILSLEACTYMYSLILILFIAFFAGHTLVAPAVSIYVALLLVKIMSFVRQQERKATGDHAGLKH